MVESHELWTLKPKLWTKSNLDFDKQLYYCTCLHEMLVNYFRGKYDKRSAVTVMPSIMPFSPEVLNSGMKSCFEWVVFQDAIYQECFSICLQCLHR